jgi:hypothetical protein
VADESVEKRPLDDEPNRVELPKSSEMPAWPPGERPDTQVKAHDLAQAEVKAQHALARSLEQGEGDGVTEASTADAQRLTPEQEKSLRSLQERVVEHEEKLADYLADPDAYDNKGFLANAPTPEIRQSIIDGRAAHLRKEIDTFQKQIDEISG